MTKMFLIAVLALAATAAADPYVISPLYAPFTAPALPAPAYAAAYTAPAYTAAYTAPTYAAAYSAPAYAAPYSAAYTAPYSAAYTAPYSAAYTSPALPVSSMSAYSYGSGYSVQEVPTVVNPVAAAAPLVYEYIYRR